jgi:hypothetical protein
VREFILNNIKQGYPQLVAVSASQVVGWCDVIPNQRPIHAHVGVLGMGLLPEFRGLQPPMVKPNALVWPYSRNSPLSSAPQAPARSRVGRRRG